MIQAVVKRSASYSRREKNTNGDEKETRSTDNKELKKAGISAHDVKEGALGNKAQISEYDIRVVKSTGELAVFKKGAKTGIATGEKIVKK